jgi:hypothetical protein
MIARISFSVALTIATFCATEASSQSFPDSAGRPVAAADISGKKFCWENGKTTTFAAGGQFTNETGHLTRWSISEPGVVKTGWRYRQIVVLPDGRLQWHISDARPSMKIGRIVNAYHWGTICS